MTNTPATPAQSGTFLQKRTAIGRSNRLLAQITETRGILYWLAAGPHSKDDDALLDTANVLLSDAETIAVRISGFNWRAEQERAQDCLESARNLLLAVGPDWYPLGELPNLLQNGARFLPPGDENLALLRAQMSARTTILSPRDRISIIAAARAINESAAQARARAYAFHHLTFVVAGIMAATVILAGVVAYFVPFTFNFCPAGSTACSTFAASSRLEVTLIELFGALGAVLSTVFSLRSINLATGSLKIPSSLFFLKIASGALLALVGIIFMQGRLLPGFGNLTSVSQAAAWAIAFGAAQQIFLGTLDHRASAVTRAAEPRASVRRDESGNLDQLASDVSKATSNLTPAAISSSVRDAVLGPRLVNFTGSVELLSAVEGSVPSNLPENRRIEVPPDTRVALILTISRTTADGQHKLPLRVAGGIDSSEVEFGITFETDLRTLSDRRTSIKFDRNSTEGSAIFYVVRPADAANSRCWIRITQNRRTLQSLDVTIDATGTAS